MSVGFTRKTNLTNLVGRIDYISNPKRQENIVDFYDGLGKENAKKLAEFSQKEFEKSINFGKKDSKGNLQKCIEAREIITHFSHDLEGKITAEMVSKSIEEKLNIKGVITAIHWNKNHTCLHAHSIIPDRDLLDEPVIVKAERNLFFDSTGKRVYKKALADPTKTIKKGDIIEERLFSAKRDDIRSLDFSKTMKQWAIDFNNKYSNTKQRAYSKELDGLPFLHESNKPLLAKKVKQYNQLVAHKRLEIKAKNEPKIEVKNDVFEKLLEKYSQTQKEQIQPVQISQPVPTVAIKQEQPKPKPTPTIEVKPIIQPKIEVEPVNRKKTEEKPFFKSWGEYNEFKRDSDDVTKKLDIYYKNEGSIGYHKKSYRDDTLQPTVDSFIMKWCDKFQELLNCTIQTIRNSIKKILNETEVKGSKSVVNDLKAAEKELHEKESKFSIKSLNKGQEH